MADPTTDETPTRAPGDPTPLERETAGETTSFPMFGRSWTVPTKRHLAQLTFMRDEIRAGWSTWNQVVAQAFLSEEDWAALLKINPSEDQLDDFSGEIAKALGLADPGNS